MNLGKMSAALLVATFVATGAFAQLSTENTAWGNGPAKNLMTKDEAKAWKAVKTDAEAKAFIDLFWAKRDPSPATPKNEYREDVEFRVGEANKRFTTSKFEGAVSERGRLYLALGAPTKIVKSGGQTTGGAFAEEGEQEGLTAPPKETWHYEGDQVPAFLQKAGRKTFDIIFIDRFNNGDFRLERAKEANELIGLAIDNSIVSPQLTEAPKFDAPKPAAPAAPAAAVATKGEIKDEALKAAVAEFKAAKESPYKDIYFHYIENVTPDGTRFVPVMLYGKKSLGLAAGQDATFFGVVEDAAGNAVLAFEDPVKVGGSKDDIYFDKSLTLAPGKYVAYLGLAQAGKPAGMVKGDIEVTTFDQSTPGSSRLILSSDIHVLSSAQQATDPYSFGGLKVIPKGDRVFTTADELLYFFEVRNPGLTPEGAPKLQVKIDVEGTIPTKDAKGKATTMKKKYSLPPTEAEVAQVKDTAGHFSGGQGIPLATFKPGDYLMKVKLIDTVTQATYNLEEKFIVVAAPAAAAPTTN